MGHDDASERLKESRRAEIKHRYARGYESSDNTEPKNRPRNLRYGELKKLRLRRERNGVAWRHHYSELEMMDDAECGRVLQLTCQERYDLKIRSIKAVDKSPEEVEAFYKQKRRERQNDKGKRVRQAEREASQSASLSDRERELIEAMPDRGSMSELAQIAAGLPSYRDGKGKRLTGHTLRKAAHRAVDGLLEAGKVADQMVDAVRGLKARYVTKVQ